MLLELGEQRRRRVEFCLAQLQRELLELVSETQSALVARELRSSERPAEQGFDADAHARPLAAVLPLLPRVRR